jgi:adenylate cyclase class 2
MNIEYEERVLEVDKEKLIKKLESLGAVKVGDFHQKRKVYDVKPVNENKWFRLRTDGHLTTLTFKNVEKNTIDGTKELEIVVDSFDKMDEMMNLLGYKSRNYQENDRTRYMLDDVELDIDSWPLIPTYLELESDSIEKIKKVEKKIGVDPEMITNLNCQDIYQDIYDIDVNKIKVLKF